MRYVRCGYLVQLTNHFGNFIKQTKVRFVEGYGTEDTFDRSVANRFRERWRLLLKQAEHKHFGDILGLSICGETIVISRDIDMCDA